MPKSWGYQLQLADASWLKNVPHDVLILDIDDFAANNKGTAVSALQFKPDGERREVISYLSIGECETYRWYWNDVRAKLPPKWLLGENPEWKGNFAVAVWERNWQEIIAASLERIIAAGYDGVYLDKCDVMHDILARHRNIGRPLDEMRRSMIAFICKLASYARKRVPGFRVIMQNAEDLLEVPQGSQDLVAAVSGVAKEDLYFGAEEDGVKNTDDQIEWSIKALSVAKIAGLPIFVVEYLDDPINAMQAALNASVDGFIYSIAAGDRELDEMPVTNFTGGSF